MRAGACAGRACLAWGVLAAGLAFAGQFLTVHFNYGGNWTGLFCTGSRFPIPPALHHERIFVYPDSDGYDGQFYHYIAHDPFLRNGMASYIDAPRLRYRRILLPFLAWLLSGGGGPALHAVYIAVNLAFVFLGTYWLACCFELRGMRGAWGLVFLAIPGVVISLDRMTVDGALTALAAGFARYVSSGNWTALTLLLTAAPLVRETGLLLTASAVLSAAWARRWRQVLLAGLTTLPALAWFAWVHAHTEAGSGGPRLLTLPLAGLLGRVFLAAATGSPASAWLPARTLDWVGLGGLLLALGLTVRALVRRRDALAVALALFALLMTALRPQFFFDAYSYTRLLSPLLVLLIAADWGMKFRWPLLALALVLPRVLLQMAWQAVGVLRKLAG
ncbi:MAG: hypothetical protein RMI94_13565 [Bryobacterales bacterium]|nr:hypothetical protein [Bryobacteraceae bacterium]MDW8131573.1 hypothetical protein [Bryobacterales bacterium]